MLPRRPGLSAGSHGAPSSLPWDLGVTRKDAFMSSCFIDHVVTPHRRLNLLDMCVASACSFREHHQSRTKAFHYFVSSSVPAAIREELARVADIVEDLPPLVWPRTAGPRPDRERLYSFLKLELWKHTQYNSVLFFDPDVFWSGDAERYFSRHGAAPQLAAAVYNSSDLVPQFWRRRRLRYINSGILLLRPSLATYAALRRRWETHNFTSCPEPKRGGAKRLLLSGRTKLSEQDVVRAHFDADLTAMSECENFRGYVKGSANGEAGGQAHCDPREIIAWHGSRFRGKACCNHSLAATWAQHEAMPKAPLPRSFKLWEASWASKPASA